MSFHNFASRQQARPAVALGRLAAAPIQPPISIPTSNQRIFINEVGHSKHFKDPAEPHSNQKVRLSRHGPLSLSRSNVAPLVFRYRNRLEGNREERGSIDYATTVMNI